MAVAVAAVARQKGQAAVECQGGVASVVALAALLPIVAHRLSDVLGAPQTLGMTCGTRQQASCRSAQLRLHTV